MRGQHAKGRLTALLSRRRMFGVGATGAAGAALLAACGRGAGNQAAKSSTTAQQTKPKYGGTFNVAVNTDFFDFDPSTGGKSVPNPNAVMLAYETLLDFQRGPSVPFDQLTLEPKLAEKWETPDAQMYTFHLRHGVKFGNLAPVNGREMTSDDVKWTFEYLSRTGQFANKKLPPPSSTYPLDGLDRVDVPDPYTAIVHFKQPFAPFLNYNCTQGLPIVPHEIFDQDGNLTTHMVGTGPFQLDVASTQKGAQWVFKKHPTYWKEGKPYLDEIRFLVLADPATTYAAFEAKQIDMLSRIFGAELKNTQKFTTGAIVQNFVDPEPYGIYITMRQPPFSDERVRQAVALGIDKDEFDKAVGTGQGIWTMLGAANWWTQDEVKKMTPYDPTKAKQLMAAAGYANGVDAELLISGNGNPPQQELFQAQMKQVGINVAIKSVDTATYSSRLHSGDFTIVTNRLTFKGDLDSRLSGEYYSRAAGGDYVGQHDDKLDNLIEDERHEVDPTKRLALLKQTAAYVTEIAFNPGFVAVVGATYWQPYVKNYYDNWSQNDLNASDVWLAK